jgi:hypothetical protein
VGAGGGGAGGAGQSVNTGSATSGGNGGAGLSYDITGSSQYYAGGGGGGANYAGNVNGLGAQVVLESEVTEVTMAAQIHLMVVVAVAMDQMV